MQSFYDFSAQQYVASPQTSFGVRLSRIHLRDKRTPKDVCGEAKQYVHYLIPICTIGA